MDTNIPERRRVLVTGATGKQGGATVKALLELNDQQHDFEILALTRNPSSKAAKALESNSKVKLLTGDLKHCSDIFEQAGGTGSIWGVFSVQMLDTKNDPYSEDNEEYRQGVDLIDASLKYGVQHFVQTSVDRGGSKSDSTPTPIPHFITKHRIEGHLKQEAQGSKMTYTILRPVAFMDMITPNFFGRVFASLLATLGNKPLQFVATRDIGIFAAKAFQTPETDEFRNAAISLAGDELSLQGCNEVFYRNLHRPMPVTYGSVASLLLWSKDELRVMFGWFKEFGYAADIQKCRKLNSRMLDLGSYLKEESDFKP